jgi:MFS family permease
MGILSPVVGFLVDRFGSRKLLLAGTITVGIGFILMSTTQSLFMFYASMVLIAFGGGGCTSVVTMTAIAQWFRRNIGKALGIMSAGFGASGLMLPLMVWLVDAFGWRTAMVTLGLGMWLFGIPLAFVVRDSPDRYGLLPDGDVSADSSFLPDAQEGPVLKLWDVLTEKNLLKLNLSELLRFMVLAAVIIHIMPFLSSIGMPRSSAGFIAAAIPLISIGGRFIFGWLGDMYDKRHVTSVAFCSMAFGALALAFIHMNLGLFLFLLFFPAGFGGVAVLRGTIIREYYDAHTFGRRMGVQMGFGAVGGIIGPTLAGFVYDTSGNYHIAWIGLSVLLFLAIALVLKIRPHARPAMFHD